MKKTLLYTICFCFSGLVNAQITPKTTQAIKQTKIAVPDSNSVINRQAREVPALKRVLPSTVNENLIFYKWKATRWASNSMGNFTLSAPNFTFTTNGTVSCEGSIFSFGDNKIVNGTYTVNDNNVIIIIKKDTSAIMSCTLTYDKGSKNINGTYFYEILQGYAAGNNVQGYMKMETNP